MSGVISTVIESWWAGSLMAAGSWSTDDAHRHALRERAHQLVANRAGGARHLVDRQARAARALAPQGDLAADLRGWHRRQVDRDHVHRDAACGPSADAV